MPDLNNTWPGKPGVPLNPEEERHHWILTPDGEIAVYLWRPAGECEHGRWPSEWVYDVDEWDPRDGTYLGPALTPAEVEARIKEARRDALEEAALWDEGQAHHMRQMALKGEGND
jgi:hypothetical protein